MCGIGCFSLLGVYIVAGFSCWYYTCLLVVLFAWAFGC